MQFNSYIFILGLVPAVTVLYFLVNQIKGRAGLILGKLVLIAAGIFFYTYSGLENSIILAVSLAINYFFDFLIVRTNNKLPLILSIIVNTVGLFYFKYYNFFMTAFKDGFESKNIIIPLAISFYTFQQIMYSVYVYKKGKANFIDYLLYILYFPKLLMGPLAEPGKIIRQFNDPDRKTVNIDNIASGLKLFSFGLFKKLVLADTFSKAVSWGFDNLEAASSTDLFLVMLFYTFEIYFDFSGYSDMAVGVSKLLNITLPINFDSPYKALSIREFWKRWHITLTCFFTRYIYIPLGGNRKGYRQTYFNVMLVFLISGIWHGANWTFILWGAIHGALTIFDRVFEKQEKRVFEGTRWIFTFLTVNILWLLFRSDSIEQWTFMLGRMFSLSSLEISKELFNCFILPETPYLLDLLNLTEFNQTAVGLSFFVFIISAFVICLVPENNYRRRNDRSFADMVLAGIAFVWAFLCIGSESVFVYFNF